MNADIDVLYIHPARRSDCPMFNLMSVGVVGLMNLLRAQGYRVRGVNCGIEKRLDPRFHLDGWLGGYQPRIIFVDLHWYEHAYGAIEAVRTCKKLYPMIPIALGGISASVFSHEILSSFPEVDFILRGDCEEPIVALVDVVLHSNDSDLHLVPNLSWRRNGEVVENEQSFTLKSFGGIDFVSIDFLEHWPMYYHMGISEFVDCEPNFWLPIARGCQFDCCFCSGGRESQKRIYKRDQLILRNIDDVHQDLQRLTKLGVIRVNLSHDPACLGESYWRKFLDPVKRFSSSLGVYLEFFQLPSIPFLKALFEFFNVDRSILIFTPISGNEKVRSEGGKHFTNQQFLNVIEHCKRYGVEVGIYFSSNLPFENLQTFQESIELARSLIRIYPPDKLYVINQQIALDPECPMYRDPERYGIIRQFTSFQDYYDYCRDLPNKLQHSDNGFFTTLIDIATLTAMYHGWDLEINFERLQRFPWNEVTLEITPDGVVLIYKNQRVMVSYIVGDLCGFLQSLNLPLSCSQVGFSWPGNMVYEAVKELDTFVTQLYTDKRKREQCV